MRIEGNHWTDGEGRRLVLRGANLGGDCKVPKRPDGDTRLKAGFYEAKGVSFVGRPFALEEAEEHFARLKRWGLTFHRLLVTWEAVEHDGPGIYDEEYLDYLDRLLAIAQAQGMHLFVDPHQDAWSRWTGGDGAPMWTLEAAGFRPDRLFEAGAAHLNQELGADYPRMTWFSNYNRLACATMWTLFFAGDAFAPGIGPVGFGPDALGDARSIQDFLQSHYIEAMARIARRLERYTCVVGFDSLNEPSLGFIGAADLASGLPMESTGAAPTPWQAIMAGSGYPSSVPVYGVRGLGLKKIETLRLGREGVRAWEDGVECVWKRAGVWDLEGGKPVLKRPNHFVALSGRPVEPIRDFFRPFADRFQEAVCAEAGKGRLALFVEGVPNAGRPSYGSGARAPVVDATHWYDDLTLITKKWHGFLAYDARHGRPVLGPRRVRRYFVEALGELKSWAVREMSGAPTLLGEFGLPFDLDGTDSYLSGNYRTQEKALSAYYDAVDANLLDSTIWNYTADNRHARGDLWNTEDLSIFCRDDCEAGRTETGDPADSGGRGLRGLVRPYAMATAGELMEMNFDARRGVFRLRYRPNPKIAAPTEVFAPELQFPLGFTVEADGCEAEVQKGLVRLRAKSGAEEATLVLRRR
jgi:hypothetical protein